MRTSVDKRIRPLRNQHGITLMIVLVMVVIMGLSMGIAGSTWRTVVQRAKEQELLFRGDQYRRAIESYFSVKHGGKTGLLPSSLEDLLKDPRFPGTVRHIRKLYKDPMTGEDFVIIKDKRSGGRIKGVRSDSKQVPFKKDGFAKEYEKFADAASYREWEFVFEPPRAGNRRVAPGRPGQARPGQPRGVVVPPPSSGAGRPGLPPTEDN
ncbi:type II secretion system protein [Geothermobacter hydrogeniphilus]|uniref:Type II secretion system protein n=1 Tax=Geothermobacter hydrogeniphilus TaxID=1969733 RepID=A0A2K2H949_9BACT|nr:type II secretion system protein [Geothermobacter hydrogeniphilus]PNU19845.1 type II secretion system protein [Geothermobacter hydrogeniphilus]